VDKELERWLDAAFKEIEPCITERTGKPQPADVDDEDDGE
jgi:hypothetical protein